MKLGRVTGNVTATLKDAQLQGRKLMIVEIKGESPLVAVDICGAGVGEQVLVACGSAARLPAGLSGAPIDAAIVAVVDEG